MFEKTDQMIACEGIGGIGGCQPGKWHGRQSVSFSAIDTLLIHYASTDLCGEQNRGNSIFPSGFSPGIPIVSSKVFNQENMP